MKKTIMVAGVLATLVAPANAGHGRLYITTPSNGGVSCLDAGGRVGVTCKTFDPDAPTAKIIAGPAAKGMTDEALAHDKKWLKFCQPREVRGKYGVMYLEYAHEDCEFGRDE